MDTLQLILGLPGIVAGLALHEYAHAAAANALGDDGPRLAGRLTPEPWVHLDLLGTILIALFGFGWGKPVLVNPFRLRHPRRDFMLVSLAGPTANIVLAFVFGMGFGIAAGFGASSTVEQVFEAGFIINANLAAFNLIPLPPLDGSKILSGLLPDAVSTFYDNITMLAPLFLMILMSTGVAMPYLSAASSAIMRFVGVPGFMVGRALASFFGGML